MSDYSELVEELRETAKHLDGISRFPYDDDPAKRIYSKKMTDAAAAIEELQAELEKKRTADCWGCKCEKLEPKRGEIVRCGECIHFAQGGWCAREFDWFPVAENDFCSMAEKMEVQDEC